MTKLTFTMFDELKHLQPDLTQLDTQKHDECKFWESLYQAFKERMIKELFEAKEEAPKDTLL